MGDRLDKIYISSKAFYLPELPTLKVLLLLYYFKFNVFVYLLINV